MQTTFKTNLSKKGSARGLAKILNGDIAKYYLMVIVPVITTLLLFMLFIYNKGKPYPVSIYDHILYFLDLVWFAGVLHAGVNLAGLLLYGSPLKADEENIVNLETRRWNERKILILVYTSHGNNISALGRSIKTSIGFLNRYDINYRIEVVTDVPVGEILDDIAETEFHVVPSNYITKYGTRFKARALQYLLEQRILNHGAAENDDCWILHLDEESSLTPSSIAGIDLFINDPKNANCMGQGEIKYNAYNYGKNFFVTLVDNTRTGDDLGRFRLQYKRYGRPILGLHGSYLLVPTRVEAQLGFDFGSRGSITEDAYFGLIAMERGYRFGWVQGFIREQSPFTLGDLLRQRRRWRCGLKALAYDPAVSLRARVFMRCNMALSDISRVGPMVTLLNIVIGGGYFPLPMVLIAALIQGGCASSALVGAYRNMRDLELSPRYKLVRYFAAYVLLPVSSAILSLSVLYAFFSPVKSFDVVKK